jgi:hypothetical protein
MVVLNKNRKTKLILNLKSQNQKNQLLMDLRLKAAMMKKKKNFTKLLWMLFTKKKV